MNINRKVFYNQINPEARGLCEEFIVIVCPCFAQYFNKYNLEDTDYIPNLGNTELNSSDSSIDTVEEYNESYQTTITTEPENQDKLWVFVEK